MVETEEERKEAAEGGTADAGVLRTGKRAVFAINKGFHFFNQKFGIAVGAAAAEFGNVRGCVFANARLGVVHADNDERSDGAGLNAIVRCLANVPILPGDERSGTVEKILSVVKIKDGKMAGGLFCVPARSVYPNPPPLASQPPAQR